MTIRGLEPLLAMRKAGKRPATDVLVWVGDVKPGKWLIAPDCVLMPEGVCTSATEDFRVLVGLDVLLVARRYSSEFALIFEKLQMIARSVLAVPLDWNGDMLLWKKGGEACPL